MGRLVFRAGFFRELTLTADSLQHAGVSADQPTPFQKTLRWLADYADFPRQRLSERAELLLLISVAAEIGEAEARRGQKVPGLQFNPNYAAQIRNYTAMRRRTHITCDNSAKT